MPKWFFGDNSAACGPMYFKYRPHCYNSGAGMLVAAMCLVLQIFFYFLRFSSDFHLQQFVLNLNEARTAIRPKGI